MNMDWIWIAFDNTGYFNFLTRSTFTSWISSIRIMIIPSA
nr:MAG TPA: hypothetical protein [Bacteriophage sp.]